ncbi:MAG: efflux RND transporter periplasmic adaptor subunit [Planctomycetes bacterium]|nr:efflux RND transporter periplasmic adaptor subunit [Planctomycetota bacterium]
MTLDPRTLPSLFLLAALVASCHDGGVHDTHDAHADGASATHADHDDGEHDGEEGRVHLSPRQVQAAGLEFVVAGPGRVVEALTLTGRVEPNADAVLHVTPRVAGRVRSVHKQLGDDVAVGELLCVLDSVELGEAAAELLRARAATSAVEGTLAARRALFERRRSELVEVLDGSVAVHERVYEREQELQRKAVSTLRPLLEAEQALALARLAREQQLAELDAERDEALLALEADLGLLRIDRDAARQRLQTLGLSDEELAGLAAGSDLLAGAYRVLASGAGVVVDRHASVGEYVEAGAKLYVVEDLASVWFVASAFEGQLRHVRGGQPAAVRLDAFPDVELAGAVGFVGFHIDPASRSAGVRVTLANDALASWPEELPLRPGMFGRVELETATREAAVVLPERALVHDDPGDAVFVEREPGVYERRAVRTRAAAHALVEVLSGVTAGERVVVAGTFLLESAGKSGELGGGHSH